MKQITNKEYEKFQQHKSDLAKGHILTPDRLRLICESCEYDPEKIGKHFLEALGRIRRDKDATS